MFLRFGNAYSPLVMALVLNTSAGKARRWLRSGGLGRGEGFGAIVVPRRGEPGERSVPRPSRTRLAGQKPGAVNVSLKGPIAESPIAAGPTDLAAADRNDLPPSVPCPRYRRKARCRAPSLSR